MIICDLCGNTKECLSKEIEGREFDICKECWRPIEEKLRGKGRAGRKPDPVFLPQTLPEPVPPPPPPGLPPKIFGA